MKICSECGTQLPEDVDMCPTCGAPTELPATIDEVNEVPIEETYEEVYEEVYEVEPENQVLEPIMEESAYVEYAEETYAEPEYTEEVYQEQQYAEPVYAEPVYTEPVQVAPVQMTNKKQKSGGVPIFVVIILILLTLSVSLLTGYILFGGKNETPIQVPDNNGSTHIEEPKENKDNKEDKEDEEKDEDKDKENEDENKDKEEKTNTKKVVIDGYEFKIPTTLDYKADTDKLEIYNKDKTWTANIKTTSSIYSLLVDQKEELKSKFETSGYTVNKCETKEIDGYEILLFEVTEKNGYNMFLAYSYLGSAKVAVYSMYSTDNKYNYDALEEIVKIVKDATPNTSTTETSNSPEELA